MKAAIIAGLAVCIIQSLDLQLTLAADHWHRPSLRGDSWILVNWQDKDTLEWIFSQHNEHRLVWHKLGTLVENQYFNLAAGQSAIAQIVILEAACVGLWFFLCKCLLKRPGNRVLIGLSGSAIILNPWQGENLAWEFQVPWFLVNALVLCGALLLTVNLNQQARSMRVLWGVGSSLLPWVLVFSTGQGLAAALAFTGCACARLRQNPFWRLIIAASFLIPIFSYFVILGYEKPPYHPGYAFSLTFLIRIMSGGPWRGLGFLLIALAVIITFRLIIAKHSFVEPNRLDAALLPGLYSLGFSLMTTLSRTGFGIAQAEAPRYITHTMLLGLSFLLIACMLWEKDQSIQRSSGYILASLVLIGIIAPRPIFPFQEGQTFQAAIVHTKQQALKSRRAMVCEAQEISSDPNLQHCNSLSPDPIIPSRYFRSELDLHPKGWHKKLANRYHSAAR